MVQCWGFLTWRQKAFFSMGKWSTRHRQALPRKRNKLCGVPITLELVLQNAFLDQTLILHLMKYGIFISSVKST